MLTSEDALSEEALSVRRHSARPALQVLPSSQAVFVGAQPAEAAGPRHTLKGFPGKEGKIKAVGNGGRWNRMHNAGEGCLNPVRSHIATSDWTESRWFSPQSLCFWHHEGDYLAPPEWPWQATNTHGLFISDLSCSWSLRENEQVEQKFFRFLSKALVRTAAIHFVFIWNCILILSKQSLSWEAEG